MHSLTAFDYFFALIAMTNESEKYDSGTQGRTSIPQGGGGAKSSWWCGTASDTASRSTVFTESLLGPCGHTFLQQPNFIASIPCNFRVPASFTAVLCMKMWNI